MVCSTMFEIILEGNRIKLGRAIIMNSNMEISSYELFDENPNIWYKLAYWNELGGAKWYKPYD